MGQSTPPRMDSGSTSKAAPDGAPTWLALAPAVFVFIWATGYVVAKVAAPHADALTFLSLRYAGVIVLMGALAWLAKAPWPSRRDGLHLCVAGLGIQAIYLGGVWVSIQHGMPAGVSALIVNLQPVITAALGFAVGERVSAKQWFGVLLGFAGVVLVVWHKLALTTLPAFTVWLSVAALLGITLGALYQKRFVPHFDLRTGQVVQFACSLALTLPLAWWLEPMRVTWNVPFVAAMLWSVVVLSGGGISLMFLMLRHGRATTVASYFYLVPLVTALMAAALFGERLDAAALMGMAITLVGVYLATRKSRLP